MINIKAEKESVLEIIKENRPIVEINLKMAKKHIKIKGIKKASKNKKANSKNVSTFFEIFMEEAYKQIRLDGLALAKEKIELANKSIVDENNDKSNNKDNIKPKVEVSTNNSKLNNKDTKSINNNCKKIDTRSKSTKKIDSTTKNKSNLLNKNEISKDNSCVSKDTSLESISDTNEKSKKNIISKSKALDCPPSINNSENVELVSPFTEVKRKDGCSQLGFSVITTNTPIEKAKRKRCKKTNINDNTYNESTSQLSLFSLI